jgi:transposase
MAKEYRAVNRDQLWILPPDPREWLPADHPVHLVIEAVEHHLDTSAFHAGRRTGGPGTAGYDPDMLVTALVWAYANGVTSSRRIEQLCRTDLAFRLICAGNFPDHVTFSDFRRGFPDAAASFFAEVLALCARLGMGKLGVVTLDGTKIAASASKSANRTGEHLAKLAEDTVARHGGADAAEDALFGDAAGDEVPAPAWSPRDRDGRIAAAAASLRAEREAAEAERERQASQYLQAAETGEPLPGRAPDPARVRAAELRVTRAEAAQAAKAAAWRQRRDEEEQAGTRRKGPGGRKPPSPPQDHFTVRRARAALDRARAAGTARQDQDRKDPGPAPVRNITDPDSRLMPVRGGGFIQGYNAQNAVSEDVLVIGADVTDDTTDTGSFEPMLDRVRHAEDIITAHRAAAGHPGPEPPAPGGGPGYRPPPPEDGTTPRAWHTALFVTDAGYCSEHNINAPGPPRLIATGKHRDLEKHARNPATAPDPPAGTATAAMTALLATEDGITAYRQRSHQAETPHGHIKHNMGIRHLTMRGKPKATAEWDFTTAVYNLFKAITTDHLTTRALSQLHHRNAYPPAPAYQPATT